MLYIMWIRTATIIYEEKYERKDSAMKKNKINLRIEDAHNTHTQIYTYMQS